MATASFGGVAVNILNGTERKLAEMSDTYTIPGIDSVGIHLLGKHGGVYQLTLIHHALGSAIDAWYQSIQELQGTLITFTDNHGVTSGTTLCRNVGPLQKTIAIDGCNGTDRRGVCQVTMQALTDGT